MSSKHKTKSPPPPSAEADNPAHLSYGRKWLADQSRFKIGMWARQTGKSYYGTLEAVEDCRARPTTWLIVSAGERQALEAMLKAREHVERLAKKDAATAELKQEEKRDAPEAKLLRSEITWTNGSRLLAMPANPNTIRGYSANLLLDEFAFHENPREIWRAIYPTISNSLKGQYRVLVLSTPNGRGNKFAELWHNTEKWSQHKVDIYDAVKAGLPIRHTATA
jgi:phage FluMu gp28-like protein